MALVKLNLSGYQDQKLDKLGYIFVGSIHVDLSDKELPQKIVELLSSYISFGDRVQCVLPGWPGLATLAVIVTVAIHGITGTFPICVPMLRSTKGFKPGKLLDLQDFRNNVARLKSRANVIN